MHQFPVRVYYEDTDLAGIVYYANYLRFIERARSEWLRTLGLDQVRMKSERGIVFAVRSLSADYLSPARFDDLLTVHTRLDTLTPARITLNQEVWRDETRVFTACVTLVCLNAAMRPTRLDPAIRALMQN